MYSQVEYYNPLTAYVMPVLVGLFLLAIAGFFLWRSRFLKKLRVRLALDKTFLLVTLPQETVIKEGEPAKDFREIISVFEHFLASFSGLFEKGLGPLFYGQPYLSLEIIAKNKEILFFITCPKDLESLVEKQILSFYSSAQIEKSDEFKIFRQGDKIATAQLLCKRDLIYPIKTYTQLQSESLNGLTNALSKLGENCRATIQILIRPTDNKWQGKCLHSAKLLQQGKSASSKVTANKVLSASSDILSEAVHGPAKKSDSSKEELPPAITPAQEEIIKSVSEKGGKVGYQTIIRLVATSPTEPEAKLNLQNILNSFAQFTHPSLNHFKAYNSSDSVRFVQNFILRSFAGRANILNTEEIASVFHFPNQYIETPGIRWLRSKSAPAPANMPAEGIILGENHYRGQQVLVRLKDDDRRRHFYAIGMTGTGKTTLFENMILQDIRAGRGLCFIDPHGEAVRKIVDKIPKERAEDVIYFDPADSERPFGLNLLEWKTPEQKDFLVQECITIFYKLFDPTHIGIVGPQFEHWLRNAALTLMEAPEGGTLIEIPRLFTDDNFREKKLANINDNVVKAFWTQQMAKTADFHKSEMYNYFISKFGRFMTNEMIRNIMGQAKSSFDFRQAMDEGKILLINLSKGKVGEVNANLLGMILVSQIYAAALSRVDIPEEQRRDFFLYADEFQNFTTETFASILSEARKFRLGLNITNQYIAQLPEDIRNAIIGNVGNLAVFRIGVPDAEFMVKEFEPVFSQNDLINIDKFNAYLKILIDNAPTKAFSMKTLKDETLADEKLGQAILTLSKLEYGKSQQEVSQEISARTKIEEIAPAAEARPIS